MNVNIAHGCWMPDWAHHRLDSWGRFNNKRSGWLLSAGLGANLNNRLLAAEDNIQQFVRTANYRGETIESLLPMPIPKRRRRGHSSQCDCLCCRPPQPPAHGDWYFILDFDVTGKKKNTIGIAVWNGEKRRWDKSKYPNVTPDGVSIIDKGNNTFAVSEEWRRKIINEAEKKANESIGVIDRRIGNLKDALQNESKTRASADSALGNRITNEITSLQSLINERLTAANIRAGGNVTITKDASGDLVIHSATDAGISYKIVVALPNKGESRHIYLVGTGLPYDTFIWASEKWVQIGTTDIDLSDFYTKTEIDRLITAIQKQLDNVMNLETEWMTPTILAHSVINVEHGTPNFRFRRSSIGNMEFSGVIVVHSNGGDTLQSAILYNGAHPSWLPRLAGTVSLVVPATTFMGVFSMRLDIQSSTVQADLLTIALRSIGEPIPIPESGNVAIPIFAQFPIIAR